MTATLTTPTESDERTAPRLAPTRDGRVFVALLVCVLVGAALRIAWALHYGSSFDESFTAMAARRPLGDMLGYLRDADSHPPLDALVRLPFARAGVGDFALRIPSLVFSIGALALFARWMRTRGAAGVAATGLFALSGFAVAYGSEARMYALLQLVGVAAAMRAESWLRDPRRADAAVIGALVLVGCLDHTSMFVFTAGLLAVAGFRTDREAWRWRGGIALGLVAWAAIWGASFVTQLEGQHSSWIAKTTARGFVDAVVSMVTFADGVTLVVVTAVVAGAVVLARSDAVRFRVWWTCGALPIALAAVVGLVTPSFLNRTLTLMLWAPILAVGVAIGAVWTKWRPLGVAAVVFAAIVVAPGTLDQLRGTWQYDRSMDHVVATARPGDVVAVVPSWYSPLVDWRLAAQEPLGHATPNRVDIPDSVAYRVDGAPATGRIVLLEFGASRPDLGAFRRCAPVWTYGETRIRCLVAEAEK
jgi:hypothetical protein